ncbi:hypothetical protein MTO96_012295 [Rhipicephalus appendiculatus]
MTSAVRDACELDPAYADARVPPPRRKAKRITVRITPTTPALTDLTRPNRDRGVNASCVLQPRSSTPTESPDVGKFFFPLPASLRRRTCWILNVRACLTWEGDPARRTCPSGQPRERSSSSNNVCDGVARTVPSALRTRLLSREVGDPEA